MEIGQIADWVLVVTVICITIITLALIFKANDGLKFKIGKSGVEIELADDDNNEIKKPEEKEISDETGIV
jgi:hypothetical protein